jgi:hypothetical protein
MPTPARIPLPFKPGANFEVSQGFDDVGWDIPGTPSHLNEYAIDFAVPEKSR